eukprot:scaffold19706_cov29-Tisochrysis_lutea.AAC.3
MLCSCCLHNVEQPVEQPVVRHSLVAHEQPELAPVAPAVLGLKFGPVRRGRGRLRSLRGVRGTIIEQWRKAPHELLHIPRAHLWLLPVRVAPSGVRVVRHVVRVEEVHEAERAVVDRVATHGHIRRVEQCGEPPQLGKLRRALRGWAARAGAGSGAQARGRAAAEASPPRALQRAPSGRRRREGKSQTSQSEGMTVRHA